MSQPVLFKLCICTLSIKSGACCQSVSALNKWKEKHICGGQLGRHRAKYKCNCGSWYFRRQLVYLLFWKIFYSNKAMIMAVIMKEEQNSDYLASADPNHRCPVTAQTSNRKARSLNSVIWTTEYMYVILYKWVHFLLCCEEGSVLRYQMVSALICRCMSSLIFYGSQVETNSKRSVVF